SDSARSSLGVRTRWSWTCPTFPACDPAGSSARRAHSARPDSGAARAVVATRCDNRHHGGVDGGTLGLIATALTLGFRHGFDWDHLAAITDVTSTTDTAVAAAVD